ncbi:MAG: acetyl-CoA carboxylase biotin carboxylase subunit [Legionellaceae bacterium]|nr:acetyl-CoA carboxylase biotin carboxylase subunit [Legionellaceae bacterium]
MFTRILIANRGEIACRIIRTARRMGIMTIAVYSTADADSLHVSLADSAFCIGPPAAADSYLNRDAIITVAKLSHAEAIHPGYGFLSENTQFAQACEQAGIVFIGPSVSAMEAMASKQLAKQRLEKTDVPLTPGYHGLDQSDERLLLEAERLGFPVLLKAACGGGGKGMRSVLKTSEFNQALASARREAKASFADDTMLIEKLISEPRHIEMQIMADNHGHVVHLFERDCSIQRRHQKIIEEAPASNISSSLRKQLADAAIAVAKAIEYRGAGTVEFLVDGDNTFYFMEMNTRLQVEHPVTEMITGLDLVEWQFRIAANEALPLSQSDIHSKGYAIECRIYAEDPEHNFMPSTGQLHFLKEPKGEHIRIETGVTCHSQISRYYDPMIAKLIAWGETREQARSRLEQALQHYHIGGVKNNLAFLQTILNNPVFIANKISTNFLNQEHIVLPAPDKLLALYAATSIDYLRLASNPEPLHHDTFAWQMHGTSHWYAQYLILGERFDVKITPITYDEVLLEIQDTSPDRTHSSAQFKLKWTNDRVHLNDGHKTQNVYFEWQHEKTILYTSLGPVNVTRFNEQENAGQHQQNDNQLTAPMPGTVVAILKKKGELIQAGEALMVLEAMKMEHTIRSPSDGTICSIFYEIGSQVHEGATLAALETT